MVGREVNIGGIGDICGGFRFEPTIGVGKLMGEAKKDWSCCCL